MILEFSPELDKQSVYAHGDELASVLALDRDADGNRIYSHDTNSTRHVADIANPVLVTDSYKITSTLPGTVRDTVFTLYSSPLRVTKYDGLELGFIQNQYPGVWGPSIDTLLFCKALRMMKLDGVKSAVEIGAGSGFISKYVLHKYPNVEEVALVDINPAAKICWEENLKSDKARFHIQNGQEFLADRTTDLLMCNPPYIPRPKSIDDNPYEGIGLLVHLIQNAKKFLNPGGTLLTNFSSLSRDIVEPEVAKRGLTIETIASMRVPLKVMNVLNNPEWMKYLEARGLKKENQDGYDYWHTIEIVKIR
ncbi:MAG TPA: methyltransferase [Candidatus Paceibacterota bacterium]